MRQDLWQRYGSLTGCHESFNSDSAFDKHRIWDDEVRRCMTVTEMTAKGMSMNARNWWVTSTGYWADDADRGDR